MTNTLLLGIVGSTAYGLQTENYDVDFLGVFAHDTIDLVGLNKPVETIDTHDPQDKVLHEAGKFVRLCLGGNPTLNELLWLPEHLYIHNTELGKHLINIRIAFLSAARVKDSYQGYAQQQFNRYVEKGKFNSDISDKRAYKHARHLIRLTLQGFELYSTGNLTVRLENPQEVRDMSVDFVEDPLRALNFLDYYKAKYAGTKSALPAEPNRGIVEDWLRCVRREFWK